MPLVKSLETRERSGSDLLKKRSSFWSALGLGMLLAMTLIAIWTVREVNQSEFWVAHTRQVLSEGQEFFAELKDAESAQRAYLLTGQDDYLQSYQSAAAKVPNTLAKLKQLTSDNPTQQERLSRLQPLVAKRQLELGRRVRLLQESGPQAAQRSLATGHSRELMEEIRALQQQIVQDEERLLRERSRIHQSRLRQGFIGTLIAAFLALIALILAPLDVRRAVAQRDLAWQQQQISDSTARSLFEAASQAILIVDRDGKIVMANPASEKMFGFAEVELRGQSIELLLPARLASAHVAHRDKYFQNPQTRPMGLGLDLQARKKDGSEFFAEISLSYIQSAEGTLAVAFVNDVSKRRADEQAMRKQSEELRDLTARMMTAQDDERRRIARNLHDDLSQTIAHLAIDIGKLAAQASDGGASQLRTLQRHAVEAADTVRQISHELHPSILDDLGLPAALEQYCEEFEERSGISTRFSSQNVPEYLPRDVSSCIYHIAQESLRNVARHSKSASVLVSLEAYERAVRLSVKDFGVGLRERATESRSSIGIVAMKERARLVNGNLSLQSQAGAGTEVNVEVPLGEIS
jgi:PAS domain S-box-containing protein